MDSSSKSVGLKKSEESTPLIAERVPDLSICRKVAFAVGGIPYQITTTAIGFFFPVFLLEVAQLNPYYSSLILFVSKAWDALSDPTVGFVINRCNCRMGKLRPWILFASPFACAAYFFLWFVPDTPEVLRMLWYLVFYCLFNTALSCFHVAYTSLTMYISTDQKERDSATAYRIAAEAMGVLLAALIQGQIITQYRTETTCGSSGPAIIPEQTKLERESYMLSALIIVVIFILCSLVVFFGVKERSGVLAENNENYCGSLPLVFSHSPYIKLMFLFFFNSLAVYTIQGNLVLYLTYSLGLGKEFANLMAILLLTTIVTLPVWQILVKKIGKKTSYFTGMVIFLLVTFASLYINSNVIVVSIGTVLAGLGFGASLLIPWSMLPDVLDDFMVKTGMRKDAVFYSFFVFLSKFAAGVSLALSQLALGIAGFNTQHCVQPSWIGLTLRLLVSPGPFIFTLMSLLFLWWYPINEKRRRYIKAAILDLRRDKDWEKDIVIHPADYVNPLEATESV